MIKIDKISFKNKIEKILSNYSEIEQSSIVVSSDFQQVIIKNINKTKIQVRVSVFNGIVIDLNKNFFADESLLFSILLESNLKEERLKKIGKDIYYLILEYRIIEINNSKPVVGIAFQYKKI